MNVPIRHMEGEDNMSNSALLNTLIHLDNEYGVSGDETAVAAVLRQEMEGLYDEYKEDPMGNQYFIKYGKKRDKKIVFSAHMDEIGFIINYSLTVWHVFCR